jgi:hypothetical protein|tara:strand:+ start:3586 stop:3921 length:336 start_codon:yes stop_codon:yes gene_type:complete
MLYPKGPLAMQTESTLVTLELAPEIALNLADALDITVQYLELELEDERQLSEDGSEPTEYEQKQSAELQGDLEQQIGASRFALMHLGRELPKHFPELSRAARRAKETDEDC